MFVSRPTIFHLPHWDREGPILRKWHLFCNQGYWSVRINIYRHGIVDQLCELEWTNRFSPPFFPLVSSLSRASSREGVNVSICLTHSASHSVDHTASVGASFGITFFRTSFYVLLNPADRPGPPIWHSFESSGVPAPITLFRSRLLPAVKRKMKIKFYNMLITPDGTIRIFSKLYFLLAQLANASSAEKIPDGGEFSPHQWTVP